MKIEPKNRFPIDADKKNICGRLSFANPKSALIPDLYQEFVIGSIETEVGRIPMVSAELQFRDRTGSMKARWGIGRMHYLIEPGLYALGMPESHSPVLVTANYKMSFDFLRASLQGRNVWVLVLDTKGVNVWCAAGKGTFGTEELVSRIESSGVKRIVTHRELILPQLGAPGVSAHQVRRLTGFQVHYGPILAGDIQKYLDSGMKASPDMRIKTFKLRERMVLIPIELIGALKYFLMAVPFLLLVSGIGGREEFVANILMCGPFALIAFTCAIFGGAVLHPVLLPWIPGRAFSLKGMVIGLPIAIGLLLIRGSELWSSWGGRLEAVAWAMILPAVTAFLAMNFTGCSTYTSLSGVRREMRWALPLEIGFFCLGMIFWIGSRLAS
jgi:acetyl-CoA decarbonylase/synthase complex subunit gamma